MSIGVAETHRIATPEGVSLELSLAGLGSRFVALLVDVFLMGIVLAAVVVALLVTDTRGFAAGAILAVTVFALLFVYPTAFELGAAGQTPGKRWNSLRVVHDDGSPLTFAPARCATCCVSSTSSRVSTWSARSPSSRRAPTSASAIWRRARSSCASRARSPSRLRRPRPHTRGRTSSRHGT
jgi:hypothetical protein